MTQTKEVMPANRGHTHSERGLPPIYVTPTTATILGTYRCTAACENCCFGSNPSISERIDLETILRYIDEIAKFPSVKLVVFSGGETFLLGDDLVRAIKHASSLQLSTRCVSNGYWAKSMSHGRMRLQALKDAGLREINISTGDFHQEYVTEATVINAIELSLSAGFTSLLVVELQKNRRVTMTKLMANPRLRAIAKEYPDFKVIESPWMPMEYDKTIPQDSAHLLNSTNLHVRGGCDEVFQTLVLTPQGKVGMCCGLSREKIPELNEFWNKEMNLQTLLSKATNDFMKIWLFVDGPERILAWAAAKNPKIAWENRYAHHCHACLAVFSDSIVRDTIRSYWSERVDDVLMRYSIKLRQMEIGHV